MADLVAPLFYGNEIKDSNIEIEHFVHDFLLNNSDWMIFEGILENVFNDIKSVADSLDKLTDINNLPEAFIPKLAYLLNYNYNYQFTHETNRDIVKRLLWIYDQKGKDYDVLNAANYANNELWIASTMFGPGATPDEKSASIIYPIDHIFNWNKSTWSGTDRYPNSKRWRDGVLLISSEYVTSNTRKAVREVLPAGLKAYYDSLNYMGGDGTKGSVPFGEWKFWLDYVLEYNLIINDVYLNNPYDVDRGYSKPFIRSGRRVLYQEYELEIKKAASTLPLYGDKIGDLVTLLKQVTDNFSISTANQNQIIVPTQPEYVKPDDSSEEAPDKDKEPNLFTFDLSKYSGKYLLGKHDPEVEIVDYYLGKTPNQYAVSTFLSELAKYRFVVDVYGFVVAAKTNVPFVSLNTDSGYVNGIIVPYSEYAQGLTDSDQIEELSKVKTQTYEKLLGEFSPDTDNPIHKLDYEISGFSVDKTHRGFPRYSKNFGYSGKYSLSGLNNTTYSQAEIKHVLPTDDYYAVGAVEDLVPTFDHYLAGTVESTEETDEKLVYDIESYRALKYRGPIEVIKDNEYLLYQQSLSDYCYLDSHEVNKFNELKLDDLYEDNPVEKLRLSDNYGKIKYFVYHNVKRYLKNHNEPVDVMMYTDRGRHFLWYSFLDERLKSSNDALDSGKQFDMIYDLRLDDEYFNSTVSDIRLTNENLTTYRVVRELALNDAYLENGVATDNGYVDLFRTTPESIVRNKELSELTLDDLGNFSEFGTLPQVMKLDKLVFLSQKYNRHKGIYKGIYSNSTPSDNDLYFLVDKDKNVEISATKIPNVTRLLTYIDSDGYISIRHTALNYTEYLMGVDPNPIEPPPVPDEDNPSIPWKDIEDSDEPKKPDEPDTPVEPTKPDYSYLYGSSIFKFNSSAFSGNFIGVSDNSGDINSGDDPNNTIIGDDTQDKIDNSKPVDYSYLYGNNKFIFGTDRFSGKFTGTETEPDYSYYYDNPIINNVEANKDESTKNIPVVDYTNTEPNIKSGYTTYGFSKRSGKYMLKGNPDLEFIDINSELNKGTSDLSIFYGEDKTLTYGKSEYSGKYISKDNLGEPDYSEYYDNPLIHNTDVNYKDITNNEIPSVDYTSEEHKVINSYLTYGYSKRSGGYTLKGNPDSVFVDPNVELDKKSDLSILYGEDTFTYNNSKMSGKYVLKGNPDSVFINPNEELIKGTKNLSILYGEDIFEFGKTEFSGKSTDK